MKISLAVALELASASVGDTKLGAGLTLDLAPRFAAVIAQPADYVG